MTLPCEVTSVLLLPFLIFLSFVLDVAMALLTFLPAVEQSNNRTSMTAFIGFIVTFFPLVAIQMLMHPVVRLAIHVGSVGAFRDPNIIH